MSQAAKTYPISLNRIPLIGKPEQDFPWNDYMGRFTPCDVTADDLLWKIGTGFGFAPLFGGNGYPTLKNFRQSSFIAIDMDTEDERSSYDTLVSHPLVAYHGAIIYPTHSHTPEKPRHRVVFLLDEPIASADEYKLAIDGITAAFDGADRSGNANKTWMANGRIDADNLWGECYLPQEFVLTPSQVAVYMNGERKRRERIDAERRRRGREEWQRKQPGNEGYMSLADLEKRLKSFDAYSLGYQEWVALGAAIAHCYGDDAFWIFKDWSDRPDKPGLTKSVYRSMGGDNPRPAGYGTIIHILRNHNA